MQETVIQSTANSLIKRIRGLNQKKNREKEKRYLADGPHLTQEAVRYAKVERVLIREGEEIPAWLADVPFSIVSAHVMEAVSDTVTPQGMLAVVEKEEQTLPEECSGLVCVLDAVADPGNVGTIVRTADAAGAACVILSAGCADVFSPKTVRSTMGSLFHLPVIQTDCPAAEVIRHFQKMGYLAAGTHLKGVPVFETDIPWKKDMLFVTGNEAHGMSDEASDSCDLLLKLPILGKAESLNAAVATGIFLYQWVEKTKD